jgi:hypothetical protein
MHRFLLLRFYVVGVVAVIGLAVWGVSMSRTAAGVEAPRSSTEASSSTGKANASANPSQEQAKRFYPRRDFDARAQSQAW